MVKRRNKPRFGATKKFPQGKINKDDEGEIQFGVRHDHAHVILDFGKQVTWLGMDPGLARQLGALLIKHADQVEGRAN